MARKLPPPKNTRNGLKWRDGRPRWEPSPASRAIGLKGLDLRDLDGAFLTERGAAIAACDARQMWAQLIREAAAGDVAAAADLRAALDGLSAPSGPEARLRRQLVQDLVDRARALLDGQDQAAGVVKVRGARSVELLVDAYFADFDAGKIKRKAATRQAYHAQKGRFLAKFAGRAAGSIRRKEIFDWYHDELLATLSVATANLAIGAASAFLKHAMNLDWIEASPAHDLQMKRAAGRRVFWTLEEELAFTAWCDANGFADVADGNVAGLWTGARISDLCAADLEDLAGAIWTYTPIKTETKNQVAMPGILTQVRARVERRAQAAAGSSVRHVNATPFLWDEANQHRHNPTSFRRRFDRAKGLAIAQNAVPAGFVGKVQQDTRDTCITRLWAAGVDFSRMWTWTGHSKDSIEAICREHYLSLLEAGQLEMAAQLQAWADKEALKLG